MAEKTYSLAGNQGGSSKSGFEKEHPRDDMGRFTDKDDDRGGNKGQGGRSSR